MYLSQSIQRETMTACTLSATPKDNFLRKPIIPLLSELFRVGVCFDKVGGCWKGAV